MVDDNNLVQVFATILAGVLVFLTLERRFEGMARLRKIEDDIKKITRDQAAASRDKFLAQEGIKKIDRLLRNLDNPEAEEGIQTKKSEGTNIKSEVMEIGQFIKDYQEQTQRGQEERQVDQMIDETYDRLEARYMDLKTKEGKANFFMIVLLSGSLVLLLLTSSINILPSIVKDNHSMISIVIFSAGVVFLIVRVYLHGKAS